MKTDTPFASRQLRWLAWLPLLGSLGLWLLVAYLRVFSRSALLPVDWGSWYGNLITTIGPFLALILGGVLIAKVPGNDYGWVWPGLGGADDGPILRPVRPHGCARSSATWLDSRWDRRLWRARRAPKSGQTVEVR